MKINDLIISNTPLNANIVLFGPNGTGKTGLIAQAYNGYLFDFDNKMRTCLHINDQFKPLRERIEFDIYKDTNPQQPTVWLKAKEKLLWFCDHCNEPTFPYDCCLIDSLTGACVAAQSQVMKQCGKPLQAPSLHDWQLIINELEQMITILTCMRIPVIMTAHEVTYELDTGNVVRLLGAGQKLPAKIPCMFSECLRCSVSTNPDPKDKIPYFVVSGKPSATIPTSSSSGFLDEIAHNLCGLAGVLKRLHMEYPFRKEVKKEQKAAVVPVQQMTAPAESVTNLLLR